MNPLERKLAQECGGAEGQFDGHGSNLEAAADHRGRCFVQSSDRVGCGLRIRVVAPSPVIVAPSPLRSGVKTSVNANHRSLSVGMGSMDRNRIAMEGC